MEGVIKIVSVAIGGAAGAVARYLINSSPIATALGKFPLHTFAINIAGSFLIGLMMVVFTERFEPSENLRLALIVGFLGAFTTFSTFEWELVELMRGREFVTAFGYLLLSLVLGFVAVIAGIAAGRRF